MKSFLFLLLFCVVSTRAAVKVFDASGNLISLNHPAKRIVALAPNTLEMLYAIGAGTKVVATIAPVDFPNAAKNLQQVGRYNSISLDAVLRTHPDLIVAWRYAVSAKMLNRLREMGVAVFVSNPVHLDDVAQEMLALGKLSNQQKTAQIAVNNFRISLQQLRKTYHSHKKIRVFIQVADNPLFTVSDKSFLDQVVSLCAGSNVFANSPIVAPQVSTEAVLRADPQVILFIGQLNSLARWNNWQIIQAVRYQNIYTVPANIISRPGPRLLDGVKQVCNDLDDARSTLGLTRP